MPKDHPSDGDPRQWMVESFRNDPEGFLSANPRLIEGLERVAERLACLQEEIARVFSPETPVIVQEIHAAGLLREMRAILDELKAVERS